MRFESVVELGGKTATGIPIPDEVIAALGSSKRPPVTITVNGYTYRTTAVRMGGRFFVPLSAEHREGAGVAAGDDITVDIEPDTAPREVTLPDRPRGGDGRAARVRRTTRSPTRTARSGCAGSRRPRSPRPAPPASRRPWPGFARAGVRTEACPRSHLGWPRGHSVVRAGGVEAPSVRPGRASRLPVLRRPHPVGAGAGDGLVAAPPGPRAGTGRPGRRDRSPGRPGRVALRPDRAAGGLRRRASSLSQVGASGAPGRGRPARPPLQLGAQRAADGGDPRARRHRPPRARRPHQRPDHGPRLRPRPDRPADVHEHGLHRPGPGPCCSAGSRPPSSCSASRGGRRRSCSRPGARPTGCSARAACGATATPTRSKTARRHTNYAYDLATEPTAAKEVRLFGLAPWLLDRFTGHRLRLHQLQYDATRLRERSLAGALVIVLAANVLLFVCSPGRGTTAGSASRQS